MKLRLLIKFAMILCSVIAVNAQTSKISSFYGVKFGDSRSAIEAGVRSQGKTGEWKFEKSKNKDYYYVRDPKLGSVKFDSARFYLMDGKLSSGKFITTYTVNGDPEMEEITRSNIDEERNRSKSNAMDKYESMKLELESKYGGPNSDYGGKCVWMSGGNRITLQNRSFTTYEEWSFLGQSKRIPHYNYEVTVEYSSLSQDDSSNF